jgi:predicted HTH domain antitoxin
MHPVIINFQVQPDIMLSLNQNPDEFGSEIMVWAAISLYYFNRLSIEQASSLCGFHRYDFEKLLAKYNIPISLLTDVDAEKEFEILKNFKYVAHS